jgi:lipid A 3-O-deacylase
MRKLFCLIIVLVVFLMNSPENSYGYDGVAQEFKSPQKIKSSQEIELEYMTPTSEKRRDIDTISLNIFNEYYNNNDRVSILGGITMTRPWGYIEESGEQKSFAFGIGPVILRRYYLLQGDWAALSWDMSGGFIFYTKDFPYDGRWYNFMWRMGPKFSCRISDNSVLSIGYKLMHVSNGHLSGHKNPAYNAEGFSLSIMKLF